MRGLDPRIHHLRKKHSLKMDCRVKPGNDERELAARLHRAAVEGVLVPSSCFVAIAPQFVKYGIVVIARSAATKQSRLQPQ
jgi:hypothetical protein